MEEFKKMIDRNNIQRKKMQKLKQVKQEIQALKLAIKLYYNE